MIIKSIDLKSYGKFKNKKIDFSDKLNIIYGENESGKSTISTALKTFLYSNLMTKYKYKKNYIPINEKNASFDIDFMLDNSEHYETLINLGQTNSKTVIKTIDKSINREINLGNLSIGEHFLNLKEDMFDSVYYIKDIGSIDNIVINEKEFNDTMSKLSSNHILDVDISGILQNIKNEINELTRKTDTGKIYPLQCELDSINKSLSELMEINNNVKRLTDETEKLNEDLKNEEIKLNTAEKNEVLIKDYEEYKKYKNQIDLRERIEKLKNDKESLKSDFDKIPDEILSSIKDLEFKIDSLKNELLSEKEPPENKEKISLFNRLKIFSLIFFIISIFPCFISFIFLFLPLIAGFLFIYSNSKFKKLEEEEALKNNILNKKNLLKKYTDEVQLIYEKYKIKDLSDYYAKEKENIEYQSKISIIEKEIHILSEQLIDIDPFKYKEIKIIKPEFTLDEIIARKKLISENITELKLKITEFTERKKSLFNNLPDFYTLNRRKEEIIDELNKLNIRLRVAKAAYDIFDITKDTYKSSYIPSLSNELKQILNDISSIDIDFLILKEDLTLELRRKSEDIIKDNNYLSSGTRDLIYFALRLAVIKLAYNGYEKVPLILDDCLVELDDIRFKKCIQYIIKNLDMQVFYFTAHKRIFDISLEKDAAIIL